MYDNKNGRSQAHGPNMSNLLGLISCLRCRYVWEWIMWNFGFPTFIRNMGEAVRICKYYTFITISNYPPVYVYV